jgi:osmotically-inducible protein OsmY
MKTLFIFVMALCFVQNSLAAKAKPATTEITRSITDRIATDNSLSMNSQHVKVYSENGKIVLRGFVGSAAEKQNVEGIARGMAGDQEVVNATTVIKQ